MEATDGKSSSVSSSAMSLGGPAQDGGGLNVITSDVTAINAYNHRLMPIVGDSIGSTQDERLDVPLGDSMVSK